MAGGRDAPGAIGDQLHEFMRSGELILDEAARDLLSGDLFFTGRPAAAILRPRTVDALRRALALAAPHGWAIVPRGGGMSYSAGFVTARDDVLLVDTRAFDGIGPVDRARMRITVQAGCTWAALQAHLAPLGLRTCFWGTASGLHATIGGTMAQEAVLFGSGRHGTAGDTLVALHLVTVDGALIEVPSPDFPDLAPFVGDCGALGIKTQLVLPLEAVPPETGFACMRFASRAAALAALASVARARIASEAFLFDRRASDQRRTGQPDESWIEPVPGQRYRAGAAFELHAAFEGRDAAEIDASRKRFAALGAAHAGEEDGQGVLPYLRADPFAPPHMLVARDGRRWVPVHFMVRHAALPGLLAAIDACMTGHAADIARHDIAWGWSVLPVGTRDVLLEPSFYWADAHPPQVRAVLAPEFLLRHPVHAEDGAARAAVAALRRAMIEAARPHGARHMQLGRAYPPEANCCGWSVDEMRMLRHRLDPHGRMNPGVLGPGRAHPRGSVRSVRSTW